MQKFCYSYRVTRLWLRLQKEFDPIYLTSHPRQKESACQYPTNGRVSFFLRKYFLTAAQRSIVPKLYNAKGIFHKLLLKNHSNLD